ncbi:MAG: hypothetical protein QOE13_281 [Gaiellaceae bacterium]|jgi:hypothetical protein|nr:hypothetical protein [Gaiellaceae bacterium]
MGPKITFSRFVGLVFLVAALSSGAANAASVGGNTPQGLNADGLRLQAIADRYVQMRGYTQEGLKADGLRYQAMARAYQARPAASFYTPRALEAQGLRWQRMAQAYTQPQVAGESGFDWGAAGVGALGLFVAMLCGTVLTLAVRRIRQEKLAV